MDLLISDSLIVEYICFSILLFTSTVTKSGKNSSAAAFVILMLILSSFAHYKDWINWAYQVLLCLTIPIFTAYLNAKYRNRLYNKLVLVFAIQVIFYSILYFDASSFVDDNFYLIAITILILMTMAAINGDTGIFTNAANRFGGTIKRILGNHYNLKAGLQ